MTKRKRRQHTSLGKDELVSDIKLVRRGERIVSADPSVDTVSAVAADYKIVNWELRQLSTVANQERCLHSPRVYTAQDARRDFAGARMLAFADDEDLKAVINGGRPSSVAAGMIGRVLNFSPETVVRYSKLAHQRKHAPRGKRPP